MVESFFSIGVATEDAMVSALAPSRLAVITMVGKSARGSALIGNCRYPTRPNVMNAAISSVVITGRRMHSSGKFIDDSRRPPIRGRARMILRSLPIVAFRQPAERQKLSRQSLSWSRLKAWLKAGTGHRAARRRAPHSARVNHDGMFLRAVICDP